MEQDFLSACQNRDPNTVKKLIFHVNCVDNLGNTGLMYATLCRDTDIVNFLVTNGAKVNEQNNNGDTALINAVKVRNIDAVKILVENNSILDTQNKKGRTALIMAAMYNSASIMVYLYEKGADINIKSDRGFSAIDIAYTNFFKMPEQLQMVLERVDLFEIVEDDQEISFGL